MCSTYSKLIGIYKKKSTVTLCNVLVESIISVCLSDFLANNFFVYINKRPPQSTLTRLTQKVKKGDLKVSKHMQICMNRYENWCFADQQKWCIADPQKWWLYTDKRKKKREGQTDRKTYFFLPWTVCMHPCHQCPNSSGTEVDERVKIRSLKQRRNTVQSLNSDITTNNAASQ